MGVAKQGIGRLSLACVRKFLLFTPDPINGSGYFGLPYTFI
jgi:hypothetical protein